ncbi:MULTISPECIES: C39 family peptidase [Vibrio]|uniref:Bacteriocin resistance protein n=1 Tax=Vibrio diazotrophicus TaxID=685 RepID=A0ABX4W7E8_VIBDI|nr:C39 family peptidase [Vibrio diazotrophicus]PNH97291.1 bacteriocin resistance protein [Vibrio diazotrophicus]
MNVYRFLIVAVLFISAPSYSLNILPSRGQYFVPVKSYSEVVFGNVLRQKYDFSCGSAALASLLSFHYDMPSEEQDIFQKMFDSGDKELIEQQGFSLLDMKKYLESVGLKSDGFKLNLDKIRELGVPGITLVDFDGYLHFVVIKGMNDGFVILGDPSRGTMKMKYERFAEHYQGIVLLIRNRAEVGRTTFVTDNDFSVYATSPIQQGIMRDSSGNLGILRPNVGQY